MLKSIALCLTRVPHSVAACLALMMTSLLPSITWGQDLQYKVSFPAAQSHYVDVELKVINPPESLELMMPTWTPGSYLMREYSRFMEGEKAVNDKGEALPTEKTRKNRWQITCGETPSMTFSYRLYCRELSVRTNWVDSELAVLNGAATFVVPVDRLEEPLEVNVQLPKDWPRSVSAMADVDGKPHHYRAETFHQLVDSPILCGDCHIHPFDVGGVPHALVNLGDDDQWDAQRSVADLKKIVQAQQDFWGVKPYDHYLFLNVVLGGGGGLEHDNCTMIMGNRYTCRSDRSYKSWLTLASHEFFHTWNVRRLRPKTLVNYDYENEVYLRQLWIAEGITSYYESVLAARAGVLNKSDLIRSTGSDIGGVEGTPGNKVQSLSDASFDTWIKFYRPHENSRNTTISYYSRGAVVAFLLDMEIRQRTENKKSLDDVMVALFQEKVPDGYTSEEFRGKCSEVAGQDLSEWFVKYIDQPGELKYDAALEFLGLKFAAQPAGSNVSLGANLTSSNGRVLVRSVAPGSNAVKAGLDIDDELIAIDDQRVTSPSLSQLLHGKEAGDLVQLTIARRDRLQTLPLQLEAEENRQYRIEEIKKPSEDQKAHLRMWLGLPPEEPKDDSSSAEEAQPENESDDDTKSAEADADGDLEN